MDGVFESIPEIIDSASKSLLATFSLLVILLTLLAFLFFRKSSARIKVSIFLLLLLGVVVFSVTLFSGDFNGENHLSKIDDTLIIGGKDFPESNIILEIMAQTIHSKIPNLKIERIYSITVSRNIFDKMLRGEVHLYGEYTGTILAKHFNRPFREYSNLKSHSKNFINKLFQKDKDKRHLKWLGRFGFDNKYMLTMLRVKAEAIGIIGKDGRTNISRLSGVSDKLTFRSTPDFFDRPDGLKGLVTEYKLNFKDDQIILHEDKYSSLKNNEMDVTDGYETDPEIYSEDNLFIKIEDDQGFFPSYYLGPLIDQGFLEKFGTLEIVLAMLSNKISEKEMAGLIGQYQKEGLYGKNLNTSGIAQSKLQKIVHKFLVKKKVLAD